MFQWITDQLILGGLRSVQGIKCVEFLWQQSLVFNNKEKFYQFRQFFKIFFSIKIFTSIQVSNLISKCNMVHSQFLRFFFAGYLIERRCVQNSRTWFSRFYLNMIWCVQVRLCYFLLDFWILKKLKSSNKNE